MVSVIFTHGSAFIFGFILACWIMRRAIRLGGPLESNSNTSGYGRF